jgi:fatty-acid desaturase
MRLIDRFHYVPLMVLSVLYYLGGFLFAQTFGGEPHAVGLSWFLWGICVCVVGTYHRTWFVNSASHTWGYRNFETSDESRNNWWVAILSFGEGWHNNHHADQLSAAHGMRWFEVDLTYLLIKALELCGLVHSIKLPRVVPKRERVVVVVKRSLIEMIPVAPAT